MMAFEVHFKKKRKTPVDLHGAAHQGDMGSVDSPHRSKNPGWRGNVR